MLSHEIRAKIGQIATWMQSFPQVGGITKLIDVEVTVGLAPYVAGDVIDTVKLIQGVRKKAGSGIIASVELISDLAAADIKVFAYTGALIETAANGTTWDPEREDVEKLIPLQDDGASLVIDTWEQVSPSYYATSKLNINSPFNLDDEEENLYLVLVANGAITWSAVDDLHLRVGILLD